MVNGDRLPTVAVFADPAAVEEKRLEQGPNPPAIGVPVEIPELRSATAVREHFLQSKAVVGGELLGIRIRAPTALGMRLGLQVEHVPDQVQIAFFAPGRSEPVAPPVTGQEIRHLIDLNQASGDTSDEVRTYWSPIVIGEEAIIWVYVPSSINPNEVRFSLPRISYIFADPLSEKALSDCSPDATCYAGWADESGAVARMVFTDGRATYSCSGSLIADQDSSTSIPFFLTASHCISTQAAASSLQTFWFYQSQVCDGGAVDPRYSIRTGGAQILYANATTDTSLLRLNDEPPAGVSYLGWTTVAPELGAALAGIHHPDGGLKKISFGEFDGFFSLGGFTNIANGSHIGVTWTVGITADGSSGSPVLNSDGQVIGQLHGGRSSCTDPAAMDYYSRFDLAYYGGLQEWLTTGKGSSRVTLSGTVRAYDSGVPICALVLANGQYMFSCDDAGDYTLTVPLDAAGKVTLFAFADGFAPFRLTGSPQGTENTVQVQMQPVFANIPRVFMAHAMACADIPHWIRIAGTIGSATGQSLCAMVLANGEHMFSCNESFGTYALTAPVDENGQLTLFGFADGFQPYSETFDAPTCE
jgi:hypothetical protein